MTPPIPDPILNDREIALEAQLLRDYEKFCKPGLVGRSIDTVGKAIVKVVPKFIKDGVSTAATAVSEQEVFKQALCWAGEGFGELTKLTATHTIGKSGTVTSIRARGSEIESFDSIPFLRSYEIERAVHRARLKRVMIAAAEGAATGAPGAIGIPFNLALSFFLFFRATQTIALTYGYDVQDDPGELAIASEVTMRSLEPRLASPTGSIGASMTKIMMVSQITSLQTAVSKRLTYEAMLKNGGLQALVTQLRAFGNASARKAIEKTGQKSMEAGLFKGLLERIGAKASKNAVGKWIPIVSAVLGAGIDSYLMGRVLTGSNLFYHKRFLAEKPFRIKVCLDAQVPTQRKRKRPSTKARSAKSRRVKPTAEPASAKEKLITKKPPKKP